MKTVLVDACNIAFDVNADCIASDCMMWTWDKNQIVGEFRPEHNGKPENRSGYCGLINT